MTSTLHKSSYFQSFPNPKKSHTTDSAYILSIKSLPHHYATACSAPSNVIHVYDKRTLQRVQTLPGHETATTALHVKRNVASLGNDVLSLVSSGKDGSVKIWDTRTNSHSIKMTDLGKSRPLLCCDVSSDGLAIAAGTELQGEDALILYWDPRQPAAPIRIHSSTHSDDITVVAFKPDHRLNTDGTNNRILLSASSDGLLTTSNAEENDEDEAVVNVGNFGCSVAQAGWISPNSARTNIPGIWAASDMETFSTWTDELEEHQNIEIRYPAFHGGHGDLSTWVTDYLIGCQPVQQNLDPNASNISGLYVFVGSNEGDAALLTNSNLTTKNAPWSIHSSWTQNHVGVVRSMLWDEEAKMVITGGEDFKLNFWDAPNPQNLSLFSPPELQEAGDISMDDDDDGNGMEVDSGSSSTGRKKKRSHDGVEFELEEYHDIGTSEGQGKKRRKK